MPRNATNGVIPAIPDPSVHVSRIESGEAIQEGFVTFSVLLFDQLGGKEEVAEVAEYHQDVEAHLSDGFGEQRRWFEGFFDLSDFRCFMPRGGVRWIFVALKDKLIIIMLKIEDMLHKPFT